MRSPLRLSLVSCLRFLAIGAVALAASVVPAHAFDTDGDGVDDTVDNCPFASNAGQQDFGGRGSGSAPDGVGDACQCGDANGDGRVTVVDSSVIQRSLLQPPTATVTRPQLCDVNGDGNCTIADSTIVRRSLLVPATATIVQACAPTIAPAPNLVVTQPAFGAFFAPGAGNQCNVNYAGNVLNVADADLSVLVGGSAVGTAGSAFLTNLSITGPLQSKVIAARRLSTNAVKRENTVVSCSPSLNANQAVSSGIGIRINDSGIDRLEPTINSTIASQVGNVGAQIVALSPIQIDQCVVDASLACVINLDSVNITSASLGAFGVGLDSQTNQVAVNGSAFNLVANYEAEITGPNCSGRINASSVSLTGGFNLSPASNPRNINVDLVSGPVVTVSNLTNTFTGFNPCNIPLIDSLINSFAEPQIKTQVENSVENALDDPDGGGSLDSPLADAAESAIASLAPAAVVGSALGINLDAPFQSIVEDNVGVTFRIDANLNPASIDPASPQQGTTVDIPSTFPSYGAVAPNGNVYDIALSLDPSLINKLLRSETQKGTFKLNINQLDFSLINPAFPAGNQQITTTLLGLVIPDFAGITPAEPVEVQIRPTVAPAELDPTAVGTTTVRAAGVLLDFVGKNSGKRHLRLAADGNVDLAVNVVGNTISVSTTQIQNLQVSLIEGSLAGVSQLTFDILVAILAPLGQVKLEQSIESFTLPSILGIGFLPRLVGNDVGGNYLEFYLDLN